MRLNWVQWEFDMDEYLYNQLLCSFDISNVFPDLKIMMVFKGLFAIIKSMFGYILNYSPTFLSFFFLLINFFKYFFCIICFSGSGTEPLTANIKPLTSPSTSGVSASLRHSPHPLAAASVSRPTPTASIRPMAIGTVSPATPTQTRMATVLPTTATPSHPEEGCYHSF